MPTVLPSSMYSMMIVIVSFAILTISVPKILLCNHPVHHRHVEAFSFSLQHHHHHHHGRGRGRRRRRHHHDHNARLAGGLSSLSDLLVEPRSSSSPSPPPSSSTRITIPDHQRHRHVSSLQASSSSSSSSSSVTTATTTTWNSTTEDVDAVSTTVTSSSTSSSDDAINDDVFPIPTTESTTAMMMDLQQQQQQQPEVDEDKDERAAYKKGLATIGFITLLFSSNSPALHAAFSSSSSSLSSSMSESAMVGPPPVLLLNGAVSLVALVGLTLGGDQLESKSKTLTTFELDSDVEDDVVQIQGQKQQSTSDDDESYNESRLAWVAGCELGLWKTLGTVANIWGLALTSASHGALLIQLTTLIVPVVQGIQGVPIPPKIRVAVILALAGVVCFTQDTGGALSGSSISSSTAMAATDPDTLTAGAAALSTTAAESTMPPFEVFHTTIPSSAVGDALCVVAAVFYSVYDLRLFVRGKQVPTKALITRKIATQALLSMVLLVVLSGSESMTYIQATIDAAMDNYDNNSHGQIVSPSFLLVPAVILWSGIAVNAVAPYLQVGGQQVVGPTRCQTIYASQPLWAALLSFVFLGETIGERGLVGGSIFVAALFLAATAEVPDPDCEATNCEV